LFDRIFRIVYQPCRQDGISIESVFNLKNYCKKLARPCD